MPIPGIYPLSGLMSSVLASPSQTTFNVTNNDDLSGGNLTATIHTSGVIGGAYSSVFKKLPNAGGTIGKYYFEFTVNTKGGNRSAVGLVGIFGSGNVPTDPSQITLDGGPGVRMDGTIFDSAGGFSGWTLGTLSNGDVIGCAINYVSGGAFAYFRKNGGNWNGDPSFDPIGNGLDGLNIGGSFSKYAPGICWNDTVVNSTTLPSGLHVTLNCGASSFAAIPPTGYVPGWGGGGIPTPIIWSVSEHMHVRDIAISGAGSLPATDTYFDYTKLLLSGDGANGSIVFTDLSAAERGNATVIGGVQVSTTQSKFGGASINFTGTTPALSYSNLNKDFKFGSGLFTVESFIRPASVGGGHFIMGVWDGSSNNSWELWLNGANLAFNMSTTGSDNNFDLTSSNSLVINTWYHTCVDFDGTKYRLYVDGVMRASSTTLRSLFNSNVSFVLGANSAGSAFNFSGFMDEPRVTNGIARYASDAGFTVPVAKYPRS